MKKIAVLVTLFFVSTLSIFFTSTEASAEECPIYNFQSLFNHDYYPGTKWDNRSGFREITWSSSATVIFDENIARSFTTEELTWIKVAFQSWDDALETMKFIETPYSSEVEIIIGYVALNSSPNYENATGYWNAWWIDNWRNKATIKLRVSETWWFTVKNQFIHAVQHEIGNVLGLGNILPSGDFTSRLEDTWQPPFGNIPLSNFDIGMVRQLYGESTCPSTFITAVIEVPVSKKN